MIPTIFPDVAHKWIGWGLEEGDNIVVERVHVLNQPFLWAVVHLYENTHIMEM